MAVLYKIRPENRPPMTGPGAAGEPRAGLPFVGRAGRILDAGLEEIGSAPERVGILNLLKCRPPLNRFDPTAARACAPFLDRQLDLLGPRRLVTLGASALRALDPGSPSPGRLAGSGPRPNG